MSAAAEGLDYWMRWQVPVCALIITVPAIIAAAVIKRAKPEPLRSNVLSTPCWSGLHPLWLLAFRLFVFLSMSWLLSQMVVLRGIFTFYFYTQWTFTLVIVYFAIASVISAHGCWHYSKRLALENGEANGFLARDLEENASAALTFEENESQSVVSLISYDKRGENDEQAGFWGYMMQVAYQTSTGAVMLTDIVFWGILVPFMSSEHFKLSLSITTSGAGFTALLSLPLVFQFLHHIFTAVQVEIGLLGRATLHDLANEIYATEVMVCMHSLNAVFLILDALLNSLPFPLFRMAYFVLWSALYVIFQWVLHACGYSWWPYPFLELATPWAPMWYLCLALVHIPCYGLFHVIIKAKSVCFPKFFPHAYLLGHSS